ncbi:hypothetical protein MVEN_01946700 [Mycena venus]|uniref:Large ribosomal subunit protein uL14m n=1 Tax=Mycena venus TaxID=2733690 RepID=A0A8H6XFT7_9AGAR|nr:hypothetical protein MVEN_01946700 [Mycena venus]
MHDCLTTLDSPLPSASAALQNPYGRMSIDPTRSDLSVNTTSTPSRASPRASFGVLGWIGAPGLQSGGGAKKSDEPLPVDEATEILATLRDDIISLWEDPGVCDLLLQVKGVRIKDRPGLCVMQLKALLTFSHSFLSNTARITNRMYIPSNNDIVHARLHTMGVQERRMRLKQGDTSGSEWVIYDVGGSRSMRHVWLPYFDAVNAIIRVFHAFFFPSFLVLQISLDTVPGMLCVNNMSRQPSFRSPSPATPRCIRHVECTAFFASIPSEKKRLTWYKIIDNSGALVAECVNVLKQKVNNGWGSVGDEIVVVVQRARPVSAAASASVTAVKVRRGDVRRAVIVRTRKPVRRPDGRLIRFDDNAAVLLNNKREMLGTRIGGVVSADLRMKGWGKIASLAPKVI